MADRKMYARDTSPDAYFQVTDETGVLDLSTATSIVVKWEGKQFKFSGGTAVALTPPVIDSNGTNHWNLKYEFAANDTINPDVYVPFVVVTWNPGPPPQIETFPTDDNLTILPAPV